MKVKLDFVTNSSSSCFLIAIPKDLENDLASYIGRLSRDPDSFNEGVQGRTIATTLKELQTFTNDGPLDWASQPGGPQFSNLSESFYNQGREAIEQGLILVEAGVDYNVCEKFDNNWGEYIIGDMV